MTPTPATGTVGRVTRVIRFNAFDMNCVAHQSPGLWRHPHDQSWRYKDLTYWTELAKLLERGRFDGLFIADVLGTYDIYGASDEAAIRQAAQIPVGDPLLLVSAMALVTGLLQRSFTSSFRSKRSSRRRSWLVASSRAQMILTSANVALPIHFFWPQSTQ